MAGGTAAGPFHAMATAVQAAATPPVRVRHQRGPPLPDAGAGGHSHYGDTGRRRIAVRPAVPVAESGNPPRAPPSPLLPRRVGRDAGRPAGCSGFPPEVNSSPGHGDGMVKSRRLSGGCPLACRGLGPSDVRIPVRADPGRGRGARVPAGGRPAGAVNRPSPARNTPGRHYRGRYPESAEAASSVRRPVRRCSPAAPPGIPRPIPAPMPGRFTAIGRTRRPNSRRARRRGPRRGGAGAPPLLLPLSPGRAPGRAPGR